MLQTAFPHITRSGRSQDEPGAVYAPMDGPACETGPTADAARPYTLATAHRVDVGPKENTMPRMLRRAAVLGATAHVASNRGAAQANAQNAAAQQAAAPAQEAPVAPAPAPVAAPADVYAELTQLKELFDAGVLTQEEFDAQKAKLLNA